QARRDALRHGVTTVFDMFTDPNTIDGMTAERESFDTADTAALFSAGMLATVDGGHGTQFGVDVEPLGNGQVAAEWVAARKAEGSDYIKLAYIPDADYMPSLDLATARAVIDAAHSEGLLAVAHISTQAAAMDLLAAGIDGFVHVFADEPVSDAFLRNAKDAGVFVIPTLAIIASADGRGPGAQLLEDEHLSPYLSGAQKASLGADLGGPYPGFDLELARDNVARMHEAGIAILAGSDAPNPGTAHGASLHQELALLTQSGLSALEALRAATSATAAAFSASGRGRIAPGARADIVLVEGDPTQDIAATRAIAHVFRNGVEVVRDIEASASVGDTLPAQLGTFDQDLSAPEGFAWAPTTDSMMGGSSEASLSHVSPGADASGGALLVDTEVFMDFPYPWAGAYLAVIPEGRTGDLSAWAAVEFDVRGTPGNYRLMLFSTNLFGAPPTGHFDVAQEWTRVSVPVDRFSGYKAGQFTGMAIATPMAQGQYKFEIDNVTLVK
ncbi:MAG: amidohydrolase family protein, partial [Pseudomonadota bacterium]